MANSVWLRTALGFVLAPLVPGILAVTLVLPFELSATGIGHRQIAESVWIVGLSGLLGYPIALIFGLPAYLVLKHFRRYDAYAYCATGAGLGLILFVIYAMQVAYSDDPVTSTRLADMALQKIPLIVLCASVAAFSFWLVARPDRHK